MERYLGMYFNIFVEKSKINESPLAAADDDDVTMVKESSIWLLAVETTIVPKPKRPVGLPYVPCIKYSPYKLFQNIFSSLFSFVS